MQSETMPQNHEDSSLSEVLAQSALPPLDLHPESVFALDPQEATQDEAETAEGSANASQEAHELEARIAEAQDADSLQEMIGQALRLERDDLVAAILDKSIRLNRLIEKLQDFELQPGPQTISLFGDDDDAF